jgi:hypothetical protein
MLVCPGPIARDDPSAVGRYATEASGVPASAQAPGAGARLSALQPDRIAASILRACERRKPQLVIPGKARWLFALADLSATWGDWLLGKFMRP